MRHLDYRWIVKVEGDYPLDLDSLFGRRAPLEIEIGFGRGEFLVRRATENPHINFLGLEASWASIQRALQRIQKSQIHNIRILFASADWGVEYLFPKDRVHNIWALFPDPWPKDRHEHHRLGQTRFFMHVARILRYNGVFTLATDDDVYAEWLKNQWPRSLFKMNLEHYRGRIRFGTKYEMRWIESGKSVYVFQWVKIADPDLPEPEPYPMEVYKFKENFDPERIAGEGVWHEDENIVVAFKGFFWDPARKTGFFRIIIKEGPLVQKVFIELKRVRDHWVLTPSNFCSFMPTLGLQRALDRAYDSVKITFSQGNPANS